MSSARITYSQLPNATPGAEISALRNVYFFIIESSQAKRKAGKSNGSDNDAREDRR
jgi:hypothetical protein